MKKTVLGVAALLCLTTLVGCQKPQTPSGSSDSSTSQNERVTAVAVNPGRATVYLSKGNTMQFSAVVTPETALNKAVTWSTSNQNVATVNENGLVTCLMSGTISVTATSQEDETIKGSATLVVKQDESEEETLGVINTPDFYEEYVKNTTSLDDVDDINDSSKTIPLTTFFKNAENGKDPYRVGTDNPFKLGITALVYDKDGDDRVVNNPHVLLKISQYNATSRQYVELTGNDLSAVATIADDKQSIDFKDEAAGEKYRVTIDADRTAYGAISRACSPVNIDIEVVKGYNVYNAADLALFDNHQEAWASVKTAAGIGDVVADKLILQNNITITNDDIPQAFKYSENEIDSYLSPVTGNPTDFNSWCSMKNINAAQGKALLVDSLKDRTTVFGRDLVEGHKDFVFEGNYFKVDCSGIKQIYAFNKSVESGKVSEEYMPSDPNKGCEGSHGQLFGINEFWDRALPETVVNDGTAIMRNATIIGNGDLSNDDKYLGGLITFKMNTVNFVASNILTSKSFVTFMDEMNNQNIPDGETVMTLDRCKCFDSYNSMLYVWGVNKNYITNSIMKRAGGAIALLDEVGANSGHNVYREDHTPMVECFNCDFDNPVTGAEPWFSAHKAGSLVQMMGLFGDASTNRWLGRNAVLHGEQFKYFLAFLLQSNLTF